MARVGGKWVTSRAALARFITSSTPAVPGDAVSLRPLRTAKQRQRAAERAGRELEKLGI
jgi:hypothetical protein